MAEEIEPFDRDVPKTVEIKTEIPLQNFAIIEQRAESIGLSPGDFNYFCLSFMCEILPNIPREQIERVKSKLFSVIVEEVSEI